MGGKEGGIGEIRSVEKAENGMCDLWKEPKKRFVTKTYGATTWRERWSIFVSKSGDKQSDIQDGNRERESVIINKQVDDFAKMVHSKFD